MSSSSLQQREDPFTMEMGAAERAEDRDSRVEHLRKALACRPDHVDNIAIEFTIGIELSQRDDPEHKQGPRPAEALALFEHIVKTYRHMDYYSPELMDRSGSLQLMVPRAAILAACIERGLNGNSAKAKELLISAMEMLKQTYDRRVDDWSKQQPEPKPREDDPFRGGPVEMSKWESRHHAWEQRKKDAAEGKVFGQLEMAVVRAAVRQFGYCHGPQRPYQVPAVMSQVAKLFPGTPMAMVAKEHAARAATMAEKEVYEKLPQGLGDMPVLSELESSSEGRKPSPTSVIAEKPEQPHRTSISNSRGSGNSRAYWTMGIVAGGILIGIALYMIRRR